MNTAFSIGFRSAGRTPVVFLLSTDLHVCVRVPRYLKLNQVKQQNEDGKAAVSWYV